MTAVIIGAGLAGLAAAGRLSAAGRDVLVLERSSKSGGHASSVSQDGYTFDEGAHVLFTTDDIVRNAVTDRAGEIRYCEAVILNYYGGIWIPHPVQCNLRALPPSVAVKCVVDFLDAPSGDTYESYRDWCFAMLGKEISQRFTFPYTRKYWTVDASEMGTDWIGGRIYRPSRDDVIRGAIGPDERNSYHYITAFFYPQHGGYGSFGHGLYERSRVRNNCHIVNVNFRERELTLSEGGTVAYEKLLSTMPLPELVRRIEDVPEEVKRAADRLLCTGVALVDIALTTPPALRAHWFYVYDEDMVISRCSQPHLLSPDAVPAGAGAIQAEVYWSDRRPLLLSPGDLAERVVDELQRMDLIDPGQVRWTRVRILPYANVVFDKHREDSVRIVRNWLESTAEIFLAGRYGLWEYLWTDGAVRSGWQAADRMLGSDLGLATVGP